MQYSAVSTMNWWIILKQPDKNAFFPVKRNFIIQQEKQGIFIPLCTKNVFLKAYSKKLGEVMYWNNNDANDYLTEIENTLK